ncbi:MULTISPECIES: erythromycin esterase family protein [Paenibacillus]|uniref:Erythromycin esterase family protein n=1 Tax=Paenibacillus alvei TaxID=44250 RepID=A0ABT4E488_PAEAL|nr:MULTISPECIES: erythromycin esterase family protein [Paenibacillus]MCY9528529.1 erythromycin esterase family protein [Paenibacillus alvei]
MKRHEYNLGRRRFFGLLIILTVLSSAYAPVVMAEEPVHGEAEKAEIHTSLSIKGTAVETVHKQQEETARNYQAALSEWKRWAADHAYTWNHIQPEQWSPNGGAIVQDKMSDLDMLIPLLADKRIVYLGENSHGVAEFSLVKTRMIQYLHQTLGYNIVAFESGLGDAAIAQGQMNKNAAQQTMKRSIFGVWWTEETKPLFDYMKATHASDAPLRLAGFDIQVQSSLFQDADWISNKSLKNRAIQAEQDVQKWRRSTDLNGYRKAKPVLMKVYEELLQAVPNNADALKREYPNEPHIVKLMQRAMQDRIRVIQEFNELSIESNRLTEQGDYSGTQAIMEWRDRAMASNLAWLATDIYPEEKIIVWGHNGHISKAQSLIYSMPKSMGELMPETLRRESYVIALFMGEGQAAENTREPIHLTPIIPGSMEDILAASGQPYVFLDLRYRENERGNSWMFERSIASYQVMMPMPLELRRHFDGVLMIKQVKMPTYLPSTAQP